MKKDTKKTTTDTIDEKKFRELLVNMLKSQTIHSFLSRQALNDVNTDGELGVDYALMDLAHAGVDQTADLVIYFLTEGEEVLREFAGDSSVADVLDRLTGDGNEKE